ncbi:hypothetical protein Q0Z83_044720 [Actinoplanes sichuanensis]|uniref:Uncharacterized protein n=1 Tax=Actinoplanes sichuanensis TaxID=512349 RepID=A0ABW4APG1_9ACTN|nr:hypothetical protein [Actinoplanes sichuanensis]BEL06281.1 hypothetical protein Q0Z83_044720 [Actinoplanes sichuanensis]
MRRPILTVALSIAASTLIAAPANAHPRECATPSIGRYQQWLASGEGTTVPASKWSGGAQWATRIPSTHGRTVTRFFTFRPYAWGPVTELGAPTHPFATALAEARGFVFVGKTANRLEFRGLRVDDYTPPCIDPEGHDLVGSRYFPTAARTSMTFSSMARS